MNCINTFFELKIIFHRFQLDVIVQNSIFVQCVFHACSVAYPIGETLSFMYCMARAGLSEWAGWGARAGLGPLRFWQINRG